MNRRSFFGFLAVSPLVVKAASIPAPAPSFADLAIELAPVPPMLNPFVEISWSGDGGLTWSKKIVCKLGRPAGREA